MDGWMRYSFLQRDEWHKLKRELEVMHLLLSTHYVKTKKEEAAIW